MEEVRRLRLEKGWNQNELAFHADLAPSVISLVETGSRDPNATTLRKLAKALDVEIPDLFERGDIQKAPAPRNRGPRFDRFLAEWRGSSEIELVRRNIELAERLIELTEDPAGLPKKLGGKATPGEKKRHVRELVEAADEAHAITQVLAERAAERVVAIA